MARYLFGMTPYGPTGQRPFEAVLADANEARARSADVRLGVAALLAYSVELRSAARTLRGFRTSIGGGRPSRAN